MSGPQSGQIQIRQGEKGEYSVKKRYLYWIITVFISIVYLFLDDSTLAEEISPANVQETAEDIRDEKEREEIHDLLVEMASEKTKEKVVIGENDYVIAEYQEEKAYKVYNLSFLMLTEYQKEKTFEKIITENYCWKVPFKTTTGDFGVEEFVNKNGIIEWRSEATGNMTGEILPEE